MRAESYLFLLTAAARYGSAAAPASQTPPTGTSLHRYLRRTWFERVRHEQLVGSRQRVTWAMLRHIPITTRQNRRRYEEVFSQWQLPKIRLAITQEFARFYRWEGLSQ